MFILSKISQLQTWNEIHACKIAHGLSDLPAVDVSPKCDGKQSE